MTIVIRPAVLADEAAISALHTESWKQSYRGSLPDDYLDRVLAAEMAARWHARLAEPQPGWMVLVATVGGTFAGFLAAGPDPADSRHHLIDNLHVDPARRSQGIGATLIREGADRLAAGGRGGAILWVVAANEGARAFYRDLGGTEGRAQDHAIAPGLSVASVPFRWDRLVDLAAAARRRDARRLQPPIAIAADMVAAVSGAATGADHPVADGHRVRLRRKQRLGDVFGIGDFGVNRVELDPGAWSSIPHWHSREDEFVFVLEGELVLVAGGTERVLRAGDCAGFPAGLDRPHHIENRSSSQAVLLEIGSRRQDTDEVDYAGEDLRIVQRPDGSRTYARRDGSPLGLRKSR